MVDDENTKRVVKYIKEKGLENEKIPGLSSYSFEEIARQCLAGCKDLTVVDPGKFLNTMRYIVAETAVKAGKKKWKKEENVSWSVMETAVFEILKQAYADMTLDFLNGEESIDIMV